MGCVVKEGRAPTRRTTPLARPRARGRQRISARFLGSSVGKTLLSVVVAVVLTDARGVRAELPSLPSRAAVNGTALTEVLAGQGPGSMTRLPWAALAMTNVAPGPRRFSFSVPSTVRAVWLPVCAGRTRVTLDDVDLHAARGPVVVDLPDDGRAHEVAVALDVSAYEHRIACGDAPRLGTRTTATDGLLPLTFESPHAGSGGGQAVVYVPPGHDPARPSALLVGLHPWNGSVFTYAAYDALLVAARQQDMVLLFPSGLGNSLYTEDAEDEVLRALADVERRVVVDPARVTVFGASMGGAGATTVGFHHPDLFAAIVSLFGDSKYDLDTYARVILHDARGAHRVNALDVVDNARNVPVWLVHGEDDRVSPIAQSARLARALGALGFDVAFDRVAGAGHEGRVVSEFAARIVELAARARRVTAPSRVSFRSVAPGKTEVYGIRMTRASAAGDAFFDLERAGDAIHVRRAEGLCALRLPRGAFGFAPSVAPAVIVDEANVRPRGLTVTWDPVVTP